MRRRLLAVIAALVLAVTGGALVLGYASSADRRALATLEPVEVLVVGEDGIPAGTPVSALDDLVTLTTVPDRAAVPNHLTGTEPVQGLVTGSDLQPGEQLLAADFVDPATLVQDPAPMVPEGMHEVTIPLDSPRALGGQLQEGETVGLIITSTAPGDIPYSSLTLHKVLVTRVQGGLAPLPAPEPSTPAAAVPEPGAAVAAEPTEPPATTEDDASPAPQGVVFVSLALHTEDVEEVVFAAENARVWLTREDESVPNDPTAPVTADGLWRSVTGEGVQE